VNESIEFIATLCIIEDDISYVLTIERPVLVVGFITKSRDDLSSQ
jgi:hypothetical protein